MGCLFRWGMLEIAHGKITVKNQPEGDCSESNGSRAPRPIPIPDEDGDEILKQRNTLGPLGLALTLGLMSFGLPADTAEAQSIQQIRGVDATVDYESLTLLGPWDDRNYQLTQKDLELLADNEAELRVAIPAFFRVEMRRANPEMLRSGPAQYPRSAPEIFRQMYGGFLVDGKLYTRARLEAGRYILELEDGVDAKGWAEGAEKFLSGEVRVTSPTGAAESAIKINPVNTDLVIAGSNGPGAGQIMHFSTDGGETWTQSAALPLGGTCCDPTVDWSSDGSLAYTATLGNCGGGGCQIWFYRSSDGGQTWNDLQNDRRTLSTGSANDKEFIHVDQSSTSPHQDNIYATWHSSNILQFARSTDLGETWTRTAFSSATDQRGIGSDITTDSAGNIYYFWPAFNSQRILMRRSTDGGASFGAVVEVAQTEASFIFPVPSMETRQVFLYTAADTDRSGGTYDDSVYVAWSDSTAATSGTAANNHARIQVAYSRDGGQTWAVTTPHETADAGSVDRYHQWLSVGPDGKVHVIFYDTRRDATRQSVDIYYSFSADGAQTWSTPTRVTAQQSPNIGDTFEFGDYNGLDIVLDDLVAIYTDNRNEGGGGADSVDVYAAGIPVAGGGGIVGTSIAITNPSFEANAIGSPGGFTSSVDGWVTSPNNGKGTLRPGTGSYTGGPTDGVNVAYINRAGSNALVQTLGETLQAGATYTLQVDIGDRADASFADYRVTLEAGGAVLATGTNPTPPDGGFATSTTVYTVESQHVGKPLTLRLNVTGSGGIQVNFDNVRLVRASLGDAVSITNPSFEANAIGSPGGSTTSVTGWVTSPNNGKGTFRPGTSSYVDGPTDGINVAYINRAGSNSLVQTLGETLRVGTTYTLLVDVGDRADASFADYEITLETGGTVLATGSTPTPLDGGFATSTTVYGVESQHVGQPLTVRLNVTGTGGIQVNFDNVRLFRSAPAQHGAITIDENVRTVSLAGLSSAVVALGAPSRNGGDPSTVRLDNVGSGSFQHTLQEWDYLDGSHTNETTGYLALQAGSSDLGGLRAEAGTASVGTGWTTINFGTAFSGVPVVIATVASDNQAAAVTTRVRSVGSNSFQVKIQEEEGADGSHPAETVHWVAVEEGTGSVGGKTLLVGKSANVVTDAFASLSFGIPLGNPIFISGAQTTDGGNTATVRYRNLSSTGVEVQIEEEQSADSEVSHTSEVVGYFVIED